MELGATLCRPANPDCGRCPLRADCEAHLNGDPDDLPVVERTARTRAVRVAAALIRDGRGRYLLVRRRGERQLDGFWEVPQTEVAAPEPPKQALARAIKERLGMKARVRERAAVIAHGITTRRITVEGYWTVLSDETGEPRDRRAAAGTRYFSPSEILLVDAAARRHPVTTVSRKLLESTHFRRDEG